MDGVIFNLVPMVVVLYDQLGFLRLVNDMLKRNVIFLFVDEIMISLESNDLDKIKNDHLPF